MRTIIQHSRQSLAPLRSSVFYRVPISRFAECIEPQRGLEPILIGGNYGQCDIRIRRTR
jgi:hypothetical protein